VNALPSEKKTINGRQYEVTQLPYTLGHKLLLRLWRVLGPAFAEGIARTPGISGDEEVSLDNLQALAPAFAALVKTLARDLTEEDFDFVVGTLALYTKVYDNKGAMRPLADEMEFLFAGNYGELFDWLGFALKVNYSGFFSGQGTVAGLLRRVEAAKTAKPKVRRPPIG